MKLQTQLAWGLVFLLCVALMDTEANQNRTKLKCCTRKDVRILKELPKYKLLRMKRLCRKCRKILLNPLPSV
ncbi:hypothetical protein GJAV_G00148190 [Gymnothorax javanicus]|nr:hypothetical protein GJAV_G00148190 [Gymnothorax javanicus]